MDLDRLARRRWGQVIDRIDELVKVVDVDTILHVASRTALAGDDRATAPFQTSHAVQSLLGAGIDNLSAIRHLIFGRPDSKPPTEVVLHQAAHYVLARGAIENLATALWLIGPNRRVDRVERTLRWQVQNVNDQHSATDKLGAEVAGKRTKAEKLEQIDQIMRAASKAADLPPGFHKGYSGTTVVKYADTSMGVTSGVSTHLVWQICSGFAHGRPWASLGLLEREEADTDDPDVLHVKMTSDLPRALMGPHIAMELLDAVMARAALLNSQR